MGKSLLVISNGHGEDIIAANILKELISREQFDIKVLPVVGKGQAYESLPVQLIGPTRQLPSGGFARNSIQNLFKDLEAGLLSLTLGQINCLRKIKKEVDLVLVVGDIFVLLLAALFVRKKTIFLPTAKSEYITGHYWIEEVIMKRMADLVLPRDQKTADVLKDKGIKALFVGNAMMDCFEIKGTDFRIPTDYRVIGILPGSREEAYDNLIAILRVIEELEKQTSEKIIYLTAMASNLSSERLQKHLECIDWEPGEPGAERKRGVYLTLISPTGKSEVKVIYHHFGDILNQSELFIGLAGTANEQAAGLGKPVITFPGSGAQFNERFARAQKSLLGKAVRLVTGGKEEVAIAIREVLNNPVIYNEMSKEGQERMGRPGGIKRMVGIIQDYLN